MAEPKRYNELDAARGIGIILVVIGHVISHYNRNYFEAEFLGSLQVLIYSFHMPLFFFIAGIVFGAKESALVKGHAAYIPFAIKKIKRLFVPYLVFSIIFLAVRLVADYYLHVPYTKGLIEAAVCIFFDPRNGNSPYLWFVHTLFVLYLIAPLIFACERKWLLANIAVGLFLYALSYFVESRSVSDIFRYLIFMMLGCMFAYRLNNNLTAVGKNGFLFIILFIAAYYTQDVISSNQIKIAMFFVLAVSGILSVIYLSLLVRKQIGRLFRMLDTLGQSSYEIYLLHYLFFIYPFGIVFYRMLKLGNHVPDALILVFVAAVSIAGPLLLSRYMRVKMPFADALFFGRNLKTQKAS